MLRARAITALAMAILSTMAACSAGTGQTGAPAAPAHDAEGGWHPDWEPPEVPPPAPYPGVTYENPGVNPPEDPTWDSRSTFGLDVDTGSYTVARRYVDDGFLPERDSVRVEEYVNAFDGGYAPPREGTFAISIDGAPAPFSWGAWHPADHLVRIGIRARGVDELERKGASLTFVIDTSGSMDLENRLELVKRSLALLVEQLQPTDTVAIVEYGSDARVVLGPTPADDAWAIQEAIAHLVPGGSTNAAAGLHLGYELARHAFREGGINRVILASDGVANVGVTDADGLLDLIGRGATDHIQLVTVGFGMGNFNDALMEQLADDGDGFYAYVDDADEARRLFLEDLSGTLTSVALDARAQVSFDSEQVSAYRLLGYENRDIADDAFRDDDVAAAAIGAGQSVTALYEVELAPGARGVIGSVQLRWRSPDTGEFDETGTVISTDALAPSFDAAAPRFRLAALVAAWAGALRDDPWAENVSLGLIAEEVLRLQRELRDDPDVAELAQLTLETARLTGHR